MSIGRRSFDMGSITNVCFSLFAGLILFAGVSTVFAAPTQSALPSAIAENKSQVVVGSSARRVTINEQIYPAAGFYLPNSFVSNHSSNWNLFLHGISRVRNTRLKSGCEPDCSDAIAYAEYDLLKKHGSSFSVQLSVHSLSGRNGGTSFGEGSSIGFKYARRLNATTALSVSGEHILQLDDTVDLGRNLYLGFSRYFRLPKEYSLGHGGVVVNAGIGSGLYSLYDNDLFSFRSPIGGDNIVNDSEQLSFGFVWSTSYYVSQKIALGMEYSGFGFGAGVAIKPFRNSPLTGTFYLYDLIDDVPNGIPCAEDPCQARLYGRLNYSF